MVILKNNNIKEWLPHLKDSIPIEAQGYKVSSYALALEGWRRGLTLKYINIQRNPLKIRYSLSDGNNEYIFAGSRGNLVTKEAIRICMNKYLTKKYLEKANVPTPKGEIFGNSSSDKEVLEYANTLGYPLVIKPISGSGGTGVIANITSEEEFLSALEYVRNDLGFSEIIVEKFFSGVDYRVYVIGDMVVGAFDRIPANVIGDGINTIETLIKFKIEERQKNPALYNRPIIVDKEVHNLLAAKGYTIKTVPKKGERVFLKTKNNVSSGGDSRDVTDELTDEIKNIAINATKAIPGLVQAGIDIIVDKENNKGVVLEINSRPSIRNHLFPMEGKARDIPKAIIDYYFPNTKKFYFDKKRPLFYFDLKSIHDIFSKGTVQEFTIPKMPTGNTQAISLEFTGDFDFDSLGKWISKYVRRLNLNGNLKFINEQKALLVIAGIKENIEVFKNIVNKELPADLYGINVEEGSWNTPIKIGFEIIERNINKRHNKKKLNLQKQKQNKVVNQSTLNKSVHVIARFIRKVINR